MEMMNAIISQSPYLRTKLDLVETELSLNIGRTTVFLDGLVWSNKTKGYYALEFETKQPKYDASDWEVVNNAFLKASTLGVDYFATWNVRDFILWKTHESNVPLMQRQKIIWRDIVNLPKNDLNELDTADNWAKIQTFLEKFLNTFYEILVEPQTFIGIPVDEFFVFKLQRVVDINMLTFAEALQDMSKQDSQYYRQLIRWLREQGWHSVIENWNDPEGVSFAFYRNLARIAVFLIVNKIIFYNVVQAHYPDNLGKMAIAAKTGQDLQAQLSFYFKRILQIDYQPIFAPTVFDALHIPDESIEQLQRFINDLNNYDFRQLSYEILGQVYETLIPPENRHEMGQYFTPANRVDLIIGFCIKKANSIISDWSCGAGTFLVRSYSRLKYLAKQAGQNEVRHKNLLEQIWGCDIAKFPSHLAMINLAMLDLSEKENFPYIKNCDAFDISPQKTKFQVPKHFGVQHQFSDISGTEDINVTVPIFDTTVGNPPYIRQELIYDKNKLAETLKNEWGKELTLSKQSDIYTYFFFHSAAFLKNGGRLGFITSNSWLDVRYGKEMQVYFCKYFKIIAIIGSQVERDFAQADVNSVITILERCEDKESVDNHIVKFISLKRPFDFLIPRRKINEDDLRWKDVEFLVDKFEKTQNLYEDDNMRIFSINQKILYEEGLEDEKYVGNKWGGKYLRAPNVFFTILHKGKNILVPLSQIADIKRGVTTGANEFFYLLVPLKKVADVRFGIKTGANEFFYVNDITDELNTAKIQALFGDIDINKVRIVQSKHKTLHLIEIEYIKPIVTSQREFDNISDGIKETKYHIFMISKNKEDLKGTYALDYINYGESKKFNERPSCKNRQRWYDVGKREIPNMIISRFINERHFVPLTQDVYAGDTFFEIKITDKSKSSEIVLFAFLNSTVGILLKEIFGRTNLGEGVLTLYGPDILPLPVINPNTVRKSFITKLEKAMKKLASRPVSSIFKEIQQTDRQELDAIIFDILNLTKKERENVYTAVFDLVRNRLKKAKSLEKNNKKNGKEFNPESFIDNLFKELWKTMEKREFPKDFIEKRWHTQIIQLPSFENINSLKIQEFFGKFVLSVNNENIECETRDKAQFLEFALKMGSRQQVMIPKVNTNVQKVCQEYEKYLRRLWDEIEQILKFEKLTKRQTQQVRTLLEEKILKI